MKWRELLFIAKVISQKRKCPADHIVGDIFKINIHRIDEICGWCHLATNPVTFNFVKLDNKSRNSK